jgi:1-acyl-sn-glycerol-3-phosphate acyltransferase
LVHVCTRHVQRLYGIDQAAALRPDRGVLLVSNHRSFFDMYVISCVLLRNTSWIDGMYFPVRGDYFYERPDGVVVNAIMSAMAMYPPVLRQPGRRAFNQYTVDFIAGALKQPGTMVGFHPEGTRNKTDDPYTLLPANPGVGQIIHQARPIVLPAFILGLGNNLPKQVLGNFDRTGEPITIVFGKPMEFDQHYDKPARLRTYKHIADDLRSVMMNLGAEERAIRAREGFPSKAPAVQRVPNEKSNGHSTRVSA